MSGGKTVVELRVHGVSGTPPEAMLNCPTELLERQSGDAEAGFYRRSAWIDDAASPPVDGKWRRLMEVYSWGGLTSGRASRALWLLLLPFTLINLAHWMLPPANHRLPAAVVVALLRLLALSFTLTLLLAMAVAVLDITVWQCGSMDFCSAGWGPLAFLGERSTGVRLALGALPLMVVILMLWFLGREDTSPGADTKAPPDGVVLRAELSPLGKTAFWNRDLSVPRMRACHVTAWTAGLAALVLAAPVKYTHSGAAGAVNIGLLSTNLVILGLAVAATATPSVTGRGGTQASDAMHRAVMVLRWIALGALGVTLAWVAVKGGVPDRLVASFLPGLRSSIFWLLATQALLLIGVFVGTALSMRGTPKGRPRGGDGYRPTLRGFTGPFVALVGWLLGGGLSVGVGLWTAQTLGTLVFSSGDAAKQLLIRSATLANPNGDFASKLRAIDAVPPLIVPPPYVWASVTTVVVIVAAAGASIILWLTAVRGAGRKAPLSAVEARACRTVQDRVNRRRAIASLPDRGPGLIAWLSALAVVVIAVMAMVFVPGSLPLTPEQLKFWSTSIGSATVFVPISFVVGLVLLVGQAYRNRQVRRMVGILWDIVTFWPRANHPLTPPSYGGRTVFDLRMRMAELTGSGQETPDETQESTRVVLVAHSQGTIIAAATLMQSRKPTERYPLLTFGSPLRRLYARNFPAYFGHETLWNLTEFPYDRRHRWINLWALSDPIGGWVFDDTWTYAPDGAVRMTMPEALAHVDCRILDVQQQEPDHGKDDVLPDGPVCGHSGFWSRPEYVKAVDALQAIVAPDNVDTAATVQPTSEAM